MVIIIDNEISLQLVETNHAHELFELALDNKTHIRNWFSFVDEMHDITFMHHFIANTMEKNANGIEYAFVIMKNEKMIGRIGIYQINKQHHIGEIGYWLDAQQQGHGIITKATKGLIQFAFEQLGLNRLEIKCSLDNPKSSAVATRLGFSFEGVLRRAEYKHGQFFDLNLYSLLNRQPS